MPRNSRAIEWALDQDCELRMRRADGESWDAISAAMGLSRGAIMSRAKRLGVWKLCPGGHPCSTGNTESEREQKAANRLKIQIGMTDRPPLPPGSPQSWSLLLSLTPSIAGAAYAPARYGNSHVAQVRPVVWW